MYVTRTFKAKVRSVGTSLGVLIPKEIAEEEKVKKGMEVEVSVVRRDLRSVMKLFGIAKDADKFERDHAEREL